jgi:hypothetical protein
MHATNSPPAAPDTWSARGSLSVVATDPGLPPTVTADCLVRINGVDGPTLVGPVSGIGAVSGSGTTTFDWTFADVAELCLRVTIGATTQTDCAEVIVTTLAGGRYAMNGRAVH